MKLTTNQLLASELAAFAVAAYLYFFTTFTGPASIIVLVVVILGSLPFLIDMIQDIRQGHYGVDILALTAVTASLLLGQYVTAGIILIMLTGGEALEDYAQHKARAELTALLAHVPTIAHAYIDNTLESRIEDKTIESIAVGNLLLVKPGEVVPVDGIIVQGTSSFDESAITGESLPVDKAIDESVISGSVNNDAPVTIKALHTSGDSQYQNIIRLVESAASSQSPLVRLADTYSIPFTAISFTIAGIAWFLTGDAIRGLEVLVVATPCPLLIATPVAIVAGINRAAKQGIIIKSGGAIEQLARVQAMAFDKTGTLTMGTPTVSEIVPAEISETELLQISAGLSGNSAHILSHAIVTAAETKNITPSPVQNLKEYLGKGVAAEYDGKKILLGKLQWLIDEQVKNTPAQERGETATYLAINDAYCGALYFADPIRPESKSVLTELKRMGIKSLKMLTGDHFTVAETISKQLDNIPFQADCKPEDKVNEVKQLREHYSPVAMVGDGVNDAPTLTSADIGIAIGARGSTAASESADIVIMPNDISRVATSIVIAKHTIHIAKQSIFVGIGLSIVLMLFATTGAIKPMYGALLQEAVDVLVILNALRALRGPVVYH